MGYYTDYDFSDNSKEVIEAISKVSGYADDGDGRYSGVKWYGHDNDMREVSLQFPGQVLTLTGQGEESDDMWKSYYKDGKCQQCRAVITFDSFDESELK